MIRDEARKGREHVSDDPFGCFSTNGSASVLSDNEGLNRVSEKHPGRNVDCHNPQQHSGLLARQPAAMDAESQSRTLYDGENNINENTSSSRMNGDNAFCGNIDGKFSSAATSIAVGIYKSERPSQNSRCQPPDDEERSHSIVAISKTDSNDVSRDVVSSTFSCGYTVPTLSVSVLNGNGGGGGGVSPVCSALAGTRHAWDGTRRHDRSVIVVVPRKMERDTILESSDEEVGSNSGIGDGGGSGGEMASVVARTRRDVLSTSLPKHTGHGNVNHNVDRIQSNDSDPLSEESNGGTTTAGAAAINIVDGATRGQKHSVGPISSSPFVADVSMRDSTFAVFVKTCGGDADVMARSGSSTHLGSAYKDGAPFLRARRGTRGKKNSSSTSDSSIISTSDGNPHSQYLSPRELRAFAAAASSSARGRGSKDFLSFSSTLLGSSRRHAPLRAEGVAAAEAKARSRRQRQSMSGRQDSAGPDEHTACVLVPPASNNRCAREAAVAAASVVEKAEDQILPSAVHPRPHLRISPQEAPMSSAPQCPAPLRHPACSISSTTTTTTRSYTAGSTSPLPLPPATAASVLSQPVPAQRHSSPVRVHGSTRRVRLDRDEDSQTRKYSQQQDSSQLSSSSSRQEETFSTGRCRCAAPQYSSSGSGGSHDGTTGQSRRATSSNTTATSSSPTSAPTDGSFYRANNTTLTFKDSSRGNSMSLPSAASRHSSSGDQSATHSASRSSGTLETRRQHHQHRVQTNSQARRVPIPDNMTSPSQESVQRLNSNADYLKRYTSPYSRLNALTITSITTTSGQSTSVASTAEPLPMQESYHCAPPSCHPPDAFTDADRRSRRTNNQNLPVYDERGSPDVTAIAAAPQYRTFTFSNQKNSGATTAGPTATTTTTTSGDGGGDAAVVFQPLSCPGYIGAVMMDDGMTYEGRDGQSLQSVPRTLLAQLHQLQDQQQQQPSPLPLPEKGWQSKRRVSCPVMSDNVIGDRAESSKRTTMTPGRVRRNSLRREDLTVRDEEGTVQVVHHPPHTMSPLPADPQGNYVYYYLFRHPTTVSVGNEEDDEYEEMKQCRCSTSTAKDDSVDGPLIKTSGDGDKVLSPSYSSYGDAKQATSLPSHQEEDVQPTKTTPLPLHGAAAIAEGVRSEGDIQARGEGNGCCQPQGTSLHGLRETKATFKTSTSAMIPQRSRGASEGDAAPSSLTSSSYRRYPIVADVPTSRRTGAPEATTFSRTVPSPHGAKHIDKDERDDDDDDSERGLRPRSSTAPTASPLQVFFHFPPPRFANRASAGGGGRGVCQ